MALAFNQRNLILGGALLLTLWATYWVSQQENSDEVSDIAAPVRHESHPAQPQGQQIAITAVTNEGNATRNPLWANYQREVDPIKASDLFKPHSWYVPPPPPKVKPVVVAPPPPPKPVAPPAPFAYMGKLENTPSGTLYFLSSNNRVYTVSKGQNIDASWRLDGEDENAMRLTYLPLGLVQTFSKLNNPAAIK